MAYKGWYRTKSGRYYFRFSLEEQRNGEVRIFIESQPGYGSRSAGGHVTHRYGVGSRPYICYEPAPRNRRDALAIAKCWSESTERYILSGRF